MNPFWSQMARDLLPHVPGEQPRIANLVKLNINESPFGPSPLALEAMQAAADDTPRLYPDPEALQRGMRARSRGRGQEIRQISIARSKSRRLLGGR
jgi:histidinol-phosphate/aromatic aminotransferase/cobyric acid decarboxylase-like protein